MFLGLCLLASGSGDPPGQRSIPSEAFTRQLNALLTEYTDVFEEPGFPPKRAITHDIKLIDEQKEPHKQRPYRMSMRE